MDDDEVEVYGSLEKLNNGERFVGWDSAFGAGARAMGISRIA